MATTTEKIGLAKRQVAQHGAPKRSLEVIDINARRNFLCPRILFVTRS